MQKSRCNEINSVEIVDRWFRAGRNRNLLQRQYLPYFDDYNYYLELNILEQAKKQLIQEVEDIEQSLGAENFLVLILQDIISSLLMGQGRWKDAESLQQEILEISTRTLGQEHPSTLTRIANLAETYNDQGRWQDAESLQQEILEN